MRSPKLPATLAIPLRPYESGAMTVVDEDDFWVFSLWEWHLLQTQGGRRYAFRNEDGRFVYLHRAISGAEAGSDVDHIDGDGLNNSRANLRACNAKENAGNRRKNRHYRNGATSSRYKGVGLAGNGWTVRVAHQHVGWFESEEEAARAYDDAARRYYGEFARVNFPNEGEQAA
jgi:hypothetical protein